MKLLITSLLLALSFARLSAAEPAGQLENNAIAWHWQVAQGKLQPIRLEDKLNGAQLPLTGECFQVVLGDGTTLNASDFKLVGSPTEAALSPEPDSPTLARQLTGRELVAKWVAPEKNLTAEWHVMLRDGSTYVRQELTLRAQGQDVLVKEIILFDQTVPGARTVGTVDGSPVVAGTFFIGYEHPMARNAVALGGLVRCGFARNAVLKDGETLTQSAVLGVVPRGQLRRGFQAYIERERSHPYRPFLHYNSWFDIAWDTRKYNETESLDAINRVGQMLVQQRGVKVDSFLFDDGWDDNRTLWQFHNGFPDGFTPLKAAAAHYDAGIGVWLSPFGGYGGAKAQRLQYASQFGYETNDSGFSLAGPKYYDRFRDICDNMVQKYGVNQFKFDGLAAGAKAGENGLTRDGDAMMRLIADLRVHRPDIYINQTTGTWPSPFWLLYVDSTWRGGADHDFQGEGSWCQRWMTYRDAETYRNVVARAPLYPLNSLMLHGIIYAVNAAHLENVSDADFATQVHEFFGNGTQLQEMYITPRLLNEQNWDDLAEGANWSQTNADVLVDTHWIGGDPSRGAVYGWASWTPRKAVLVLRNPTGQPMNYTINAQKVFELPSDAPATLVMHSPWKKDQDQPVTVFKSNQPSVIQLQPFEVLLLQEVAAK